MGRAASNRSGSPEAARAYLVRRWGDVVIAQADNLLTFCLAQDRRRTDVTGHNMASAEAREVLEDLGSTSSSLRRRAAARLTADHDVIRRAGAACASGNSGRHRLVAEALESFCGSPGARAGRRLRGVLRDERPASWRVALVQRAVRAVPRLASATATEWAYFEIASGLDEHCHPNDFGRLRRDRWREVLRESSARRFGGVNLAPRR